jgi:hypothetical protein
MSRVLLLLLALSSGCKTAEIAVDHQLTGIHVAAKFEAKDSSRNVPPGPASMPNSQYELASSEVGSGNTPWNGGDTSDSLRR